VRKESCTACHELLHSQLATHTRFCVSSATRYEEAGSAVLLAPETRVVLSRKRPQDALAAWEELLAYAAVAVSAAQEVPASAVFLHRQSTQPSREEAKATLIGLPLLIAQKRVCRCVAPLRARVGGVAAYGAGRKRCGKIRYAYGMRLLPLEKVMLRILSRHSRWRRLPRHA